MSSLFLWTFGIRWMTMSFGRLKKEKTLQIWRVLSGRQDSNLRPSGPKPDALPGCATPRIRVTE